MIRLSPRLAAIAALVPENARIADVGTDHGYLSVFLAQTKAPLSVIATDIRPGPLESAKRHVGEAGLEKLISLRLCDGLESVSPEEADTILIAGMGGEVIQGILARAPWTLRGKLLILSPQSKQEVLRRWLYAQHCGIREEHLVEDGGKIYPILVVEGTPDREPTSAEYFIGAWPAERRDGLFYRHLAAQTERLERERQGLLCSKEEEKRNKLPELEALIAGLRKPESGE